MCTNKIQSFVVLMLISLLSTGLGGCDVVSSIFNEDKEGFGTEAGPILYIGKQNKPFTKYHRKQLYSMNSDGSEVKQLTDTKDYEVIQAQWSPDGDHIAVVRNALNSATQWGQNIFIVDSEGKNERRMIVEDKDSYGIRGISTPIWSPDARKIAFTGLTNVGNDGSGGSYDVYTLDVETKELNKITSTSRVKEFLGNWSADGKIYASERYLNTSPQRTQVIVLNEQGETVEAWERYVEGYSTPRLSHNGEYLSFMKEKLEGSSGDETNRRVMFMEKGGDPDSAEVLTKGSYQDYIPAAWSPDDSELLVMGKTPNTDRQQDEPPSHYHVLRVSRNGQNVTEITPENENYYYQPVSWIAPEKIGSSQ